MRASGAHGDPTRQGGEPLRPPASGDRRQ
jgi:hypothetical protein